MQFAQTEYKKLNESLCPCLLKNVSAQNFPAVLITLAVRQGRTIDLIRRINSPLLLRDFFVGM